MLERGLAGRTEREVAAAAEARIRELGAEPSFPAIVAAGENGALPHAEPVGARDRARATWSSSTWARSSTATARTAPGPSPSASPAPRRREVYELVRAAQAAGLEAIARRRRRQEADEAARSVIRDGGHGEHFGHGLGHGVGLEVHEAPRLGQRSEDVLERATWSRSSRASTCPGEFGVRIEDLVVVTEDGHRNLSSLPKELRIVD